MLKAVLVTAALLIAANVAIASSVRVNAPAPPGVNIQIGAPPVPQPVIVERETIIVKEKSDRGKHKGHYKEKKDKKHKKHKD